MRTIFTYAKKYIVLAMLSSAFMIAEVALDLIQPRMMARIVNEGIRGLAEAVTRTSHWSYRSASE